MPLDSGEIYSFGRFILIPDQVLLQDGDVGVKLRPRSFDVLCYLVRHRGRLVSKDELLDAIWPQAFVSEDSLAQCVHEIRQALQDDSKALLQTIPKRGYRFTDAVATHPVEGRDEPIPERARVRPASLPATLALIATALLVGILGIAMYGNREEAAKRLTIAVLPFANLSEGSNSSWLGEGIAEDLMVAIARFRDVTVIARNSAFRYSGEADAREVSLDLGAEFLLQGTARRAQNRLRVTAQLVDGQSGAVRWSDAYNGEVSDVFSIQDQIISQLAGKLVAHARESAVASARAKPPDNLEVYELVLRGRKAFLSFTRNGAAEARALVEKAVALDPDYAPAWELLSRVLMQFYIQPYDAGQGSEQILDLAYRAAQQAVATGPELSTAHGSLGWVLVYRREHEASLEALRTAVEINPSDADSYRNLATVLGHVGRYEASLAAWDESVRLDPFFPPIVLALQARAHVMLGQYDKAVPLARNCSRRAPELMPCYFYLAISTHELGHREEAEAAVARILDIDPAFTISQQLRVTPIASEAEALRFAHLLQKVGLPW